MRVFCINENGWVKKCFLYSLFKRMVGCKGPSYGDICTVTGCSWEDGEMYYDLQEWPSRKKNDGFEGACFIPLSETEMDRNYQTEKQTI